MTKITIKLAGINLTLTEEQLESIDKQRKNIKTLDNLHSYEDACIILNEEVNPKASIDDQLKMIIKAANFIENGNKEWKATFNTNQRNYIPYFNKTNKGWVLHFVFYYFDCSYLGSGYYFISETLAKTIVDRFNITYIKWLE